MSVKDDHTNAPFLEQFPEKEQADIKKIWKASKKTHSNEPEVTPQETEDAFEKVNRRIESENAPAEKVRNDHRRAWIWPTAAAAVIIITVIAWLFIPRTVSVPDGEVARVMLPDSSEVILNSGSRLQYNALYSYTNRKLELNGEGFFSVRHGDHAFVVHMQNATVKVTGTAFNVRSWAKDPHAPTEVTVVEGTVRFYRSDPANPVKIKPNEISHITDKMKKPSVPQKIDIGRVLGWRSNKLIFNNRSLRVIFNEMERRFAIKITIENSEIVHQKLSAYYSDPKDAESVLKDICRVKDLHYAKTANGFRVFKND